MLLKIKNNFYLFIYSEIKDKLFLGFKNSIIEKSEFLSFSFSSFSLKFKLLLLIYFFINYIITYYYYLLYIQNHY